jgi:hypothetical protein
MVLVFQIGLDKLSSIDYIINTRGSDFHKQKEIWMKKMLLAGLVLMGFAFAGDAAEITNKERGYVLRKMEVEVKDTAFYKNVVKFIYEGKECYYAVVDTIPYLQFASDSLQREIEASRQGEYDYTTRDFATRKAKDLEDAKQEMIKTI